MKHRALPQEDNRGLLQRINQWHMWTRLSEGAPEVVRVTKGTLKNVGAGGTLCQGSQIQLPSEAEQIINKTRQMWAMLNWQANPSAKRSSHCPVLADCHQMRHRFICHQMKLTFREKLEVIFV